MGQAEVSVEIKGASRVDKKRYIRIGAFTEAFSPKKSILVCNEKKKNDGKIVITPGKYFCTTYGAVRYYKNKPTGSRR